MIISLVFTLFFAIFCYGVVSFYFSGFVKEPRSLKNRLIKIAVSITLGALCNLFKMLAIAAAHLTLLFGISVLALKLYKRFIKKKPSPKVYGIIKKIYKTGLVPVIMVIALFVYGYFNMNNIIQTTYTVKSDKLQNDYRVVFVSDIHYGSVQSGDVLKNTVAKINKLKPDVVILGGDILDESADNEKMLTCFEDLSDIDSTYGTFFIYGNHDRQRYSPSPTFTEEQLSHAIHDAGITVLREDTFEINNDLIILGREDLGSEADRKTKGQLLSELDSKKFILTADHQPAKAKNNALLGSDLILSGHTHAGQIFPIGLLTFFNGGYSYGEYNVDNSKLIVSSGFAGWGFPIRTSKHSEYVVVDLEKQ